MIVSGKQEVTIADYAIRSFSKVTKLDFELIVYSNYIEQFSKDKYFPKWKQLDYVRLIENSHHDPDTFVFDDKIDLQHGNFDLPGKIWDEQLKKIDTDFLGVVDADFEIIEPEFIYESMEILKTDKTVLGVSMGFHPGHITVSKQLPKNIVGRSIMMQPHWSNFFVIYRKCNLDFNISFNLQYEKFDNGNYYIWDTHSKMQCELFKRGLTMHWLEKKYQLQGVHYWGFSKNTKLNDIYIKMYRKTKILSHRGIYGIKYTNYIFRVIENFFWGSFNLSRSIIKFKPNGTK